MISITYYQIYNKLFKQMDISVQISQIFKINLQNDKIYDSNLN